ncbi:hypothetical protein S83_069802, partial [Arachis hypogaea]
MNYTLITDNLIVGSQPQKLKTSITSRRKRNRLEVNNKEVSRTRCLTYEEA